MEIDDARLFVAVIVMAELDVFTACDPNDRDAGDALIEAGGALMLKNPRPKVEARIRRVGRKNPIPKVIALGRPVPYGSHVVPPSVEAKTPVSVARYRELSTSGSMVMASAGMLGKLPLMSIQVVPPFVVLKTCPFESPKPVKPVTVT